MLGVQVHNGCMGSFEAGKCSNTTCGKVVDILGKMLSEAKCRQWVVTNKAAYDSCGVVLRCAVHRPCAVPSRE